MFGRYVLLTDFLSISIACAFITQPDYFDLKSGAW
jgi:hypothetical protein